MAREFPTEDALSVTTGRLLCPMGRVYGILNYLTGDDLFTHQLPRAMDECKPHLIGQDPRLDPCGPELAAAFGTLALALESKAEGGGFAVVNGWLERDVYPRLGRTVTLEPIPARDHARISPVVELEMMTDKPVHVVELGRRER